MAKKRKGNPHYRRGVQKERQLMELFKARGASVMRTAGSHGAWDVIVDTDTESRRIQCKRTKEPIKNVTSFFAEDLSKMQKAKTPPGVLKELWLWTDHQGWKVYRLTNDELIETQSL